METEKPVNFFFRFEDLRVYHKALDYVCYVNSFVDKLQPSPDLGKHFCCSAQSIAVNIAEGSGRNKTQFIYYLKMAKSSIRECIVLTSIASQLNLIDEKVTEDSRQFLIEMTKMVGALIASLQRNIKGSEQGDEEEMDSLDEDFNKL